MEQLSAHETVEQFIKAVKSDKSGEFEKAIALCQKTWVQGYSLDKGELLESLKAKIESKFDIKEVNKVSAVCLDFGVFFPKKGLFKVRVIRESEPYKTDKAGTWGVNPLSFRGV